MAGADLGIAVVGLGFGEEFVRIYADHPDVRSVAVVDPSLQRLYRVAETHGIADRFTRIEDVLGDPRWDAVHILAPVRHHAEYAVAVLDAGQHCACAVPMATDLAGIHAVLEAQRRSGKTYMMMETSVFSREFFLAQQIYQRGDLGEITLYRGSHIQNLDGYPSYWRGYPPMHYVTHALSPLLALTGSTVRDVVARGSGRLAAEREGDYDNAFPTEVGLFRLSDHDAVGDVTMSFFQTARPYTEGFSLYGDAQGLQWPAVEGEPLRLFELSDVTADPMDRTAWGRRCRSWEVSPPEVLADLPSSIAHHGRALRSPDGTLRSPPHGGSHPHLVHEFVSSIVQARPSTVDAVTAARFTAPGVCAHSSALMDGERVIVPEFHHEMSAR